MTPTRAKERMAIFTVLLSRRGVLLTVFVVLVAGVMSMLTSPESQPAITRADVTIEFGRDGEGVVEQFTVADGEELLVIESYLFDFRGNSPPLMPDCQPTMHIVFAFEDGSSCEVEACTGEWWVKNGDRGGDAELELKQYLIDLAEQAKAR